MTLERLAALAGIRADSHEQAVFAEAAVLARARQIATDADLGLLLDSPPGGPTLVRAEIPLA